jgi:hypothetical protein
VISIGVRNRVIGAVKVTARPELEDLEETAVGQQLSLLDGDEKKRKRQKRSKK